MSYEGSKVSVSRLPLATASAAGAVVAGSNITVSSGTISLTSGNVTAALTYTPVNPASATSYSAQQYFAESTLTDAATISWNASANQVTKVTLGGNRTMGAPTNLVAGAFYSLMIIQDATGSRTLAWNSVFKFTSGVAPTLTTTANAKDLITFRSDGTNLYEVGRSLNLG